ncbi:MAG: DUF2868 domain-containing protein [Deltaproteobacteria bacterium]|nr:DUF2868 domain-containing protein [Deltaproteobacteria bacterium]
MKTKWRIRDLIDLEYFFHRDENNGDESAREAKVQGDRDIYLKYIEPLLKKERSLSRPSIIRLWLKHRRIAEKEALGEETLLPGDAFQEIYRLLYYAVAIIGIFIGSGLAFSFLSYRGDDPLNVSIYVGVLIFMQILLLLLVLGISTVRVASRSFSRSSILYSLVSELMVKLILKLERRAMRSLWGTQRDSLQAAIGLAKGKKKVYGSIFFWPAFLLAQVFGVGFNLGVLSATLLRVLGSDIAFGWQSTVQLSSRFVYDLVELLALPWSWFISPEMAHPSLAQIEGSRIVLKDGIYHLATQDLVSWWPFLCLAVLFYGLLPRLVMLMAGLFAQNRALTRQDFNHNACERLMERMKIPLLITRGRPVATAHEMHPGDDKVQHLEALGTVQGNNIPHNRLMALVPDDIYEDCPDDELDGLIFSTLGYGVQEKIRIGKDYETDKALLDRLSRKEWGDVIPAVLILQEAWQPPIQETLKFILDLRKALGESARIVVALIGKPGPASIFTPVKEEDWITWGKRLNIMGDPFLGIERLAADES